MLATTHDVYVDCYVVPGRQDDDVEGAVLACLLRYLVGGMASNDACGAQASLPALDRA